MLSITVFKLVAGVVVGNIISTLILRAASDVLAAFQRDEAFVRGDEAFVRGDEAP